ncbi:hypothetical protein LguiA_003256 [Lonicera macranthoides]
MTLVILRYSSSFLPSLTPPTHYYYSTLSSPSPPIPIPIHNPQILNYLINYLGFPKPQALSVSNRFQWIKTPQKPQSVVQFFTNLGFSETHIRSSVRTMPQILFAGVEKTLKPKLDFFQELGLTGPHLGKFISKNSNLLTCSLDRKLTPRVEIFKKILGNDKNNEDLMRVLRRSNAVASRYQESRLLNNVCYLESCGIVGSQLALLLKRQPMLFIKPENELRGLVSRVLEMGFSSNSRILAHAVYTVSCMSNETFTRKFELFRSFGFEEVEFMQMFRKCPMLLRTSEGKLRIGIDFYLNVVKFERILLVRRPTCLMHNMVDRVIPRYRVLEVMKSKRLLKKEPSFMNVLSLPEEDFLQKFIFRYRDNAEELMVAYKGHIGF